MKIDRLIAMTMFLLNRETVSASTLAERFEVSKRTIQRDIDTLNQAGIPIVSTYGTEGGYEIKVYILLENPKQLKNGICAVYILEIPKEICLKFARTVLFNKLPIICLTAKWSRSIGHLEGKPYDRIE